MSKPPEPTGFPTIKAAWEALPPESRQLLSKVWDERKQKQVST